jgi:hypothetical protein
MNLSLESLDGLLSLFLFFSFFSDLPIFAEEQKKKFEGPELYRLFLSPHSFSVTTVTLGSRLFFILLQINLLSLPT